MSNESNVASASSAKTNVASRTRSVAFIALCVAITAVSAWVTVPLGPVPFTLQMFAITFAIVVLSPKQAMAAILCYLALGAVSLPMFSGMRGGIGVLMGPTGGFLWGYIFGVAAGCAVLWLFRRGGSAKGAAAALSQLRAGGTSFASKVGVVLRTFGVEILAGVVFTGIAYVCGCLQFTQVMNVGVEAAILTCVAPFVVVDLMKIVAAVICAEGVLAALPKRGVSA